MYWQVKTGSVKDKKRSLLSLIIKVMKIKTTMRYYFIPTRMAGIKKSNNIRGHRGAG